MEQTTASHKGNNPTPEPSSESGKGARTREMLLDAAERSVLEKGFGATSIEELIAEVGITKSGFFYHFKDKGQLAEDLLRRYIERENALFDDLFRRADELNDDPLHGFLIWLKLFSEMVADMPQGHPGCLIASYTYQERLFDKKVKDLNASALLGWQTRFRDRLGRIAERYPPRREIDLDDLAKMLSVIADGAITMSKTINDKSVMPRQILLYRDYVRSVFLGSS